MNSSEAIRVKDTGERPKVSVVLGVRNEYPVILGTIYSFMEELEFWGYEWEFVIVNNLSTDNCHDILMDKFRRWYKSGQLKLVTYDEKPANVTVRNIGAREATGDVVFVGDGHLSITIGTLHGMIQGWVERGGLWHSAIQIWGDLKEIKTYGYDLKLHERFWGNLCRGVPLEVAENPKARYSAPRVPYYRVPMASHCLVMAGREEYLEKGGYSEHFTCYGGGEPYLDLKWWLYGGEVWIYADGLVRHAFGTNAQWKKVPKDKTIRSAVHKKDRTQSRELKAGEEYLHYSRGYAWTNDWFQQNFMMSAYLIGGYRWLQKMYGMYLEGRKGNPRYVKDVKEFRRDILAKGSAERRVIEERSICSLDELLGEDENREPAESSHARPWERYDDL